MDSPTSKLPSEVELAFDVMPCQAMRRSYEPGGNSHACSYFAEWGLYHSFDYDASGPPPTVGIKQDTVYVGKSALLPEILSGCRKAPIMAVGINPNLPGFWEKSRNAVNPFFDDLIQYAHYFRYRSIAKLQIPPTSYKKLRAGRQDSPKNGEPLVKIGEHIDVELAPVKMYIAYQSLLDSLAEKMGWLDHKLTVGEDMSYGNMVACPSAKWVITTDPVDASMPVMGQARVSGIIKECFFKRRHFLRQLFQSLPAVLLVFSESTGREFITAMQGNFSKGNPQPGESIDALLGREIRLRYGADDNGKDLDARVVFMPHASANPQQFAAVKEQVVNLLLEEVRAAKLVFNPTTKHLLRPVGGCVFCSNDLYKIGECDYKSELRPLKQALGGLAASASLTAEPMTEKAEQQRLLSEFLLTSPAQDGAEDPWMRGGKE